MTEISLVPRGALKGVDVGLSVSTSADLGRLGLQEQHADQAIAELARGILVAGGSVTYGGWLEPRSFTELLMTEVNAFGEGSTRLTLVVAFPEHRKLRLSLLARIRRDLFGLGRLVFLDPGGHEISMDDRRGETPEEVTDVDVKRRSYSSLRRVMAERTDARVIVGGKLADYQGIMPGLIEEAIASVRANQPLYVAGGFGGAAAAIVQALEIDPMAWLPPGVPANAERPDVITALALLRQAVEAFDGMPHDGMGDQDRRALSATFRTGEIASLVSVGLSTRFGDANLG